jgi:GntR family transcriptional repressor for pyruvate dehydrogenase complex
MATFRSVSVTRSYEQVVEQLLGRIRAGDFLPGSRLPTERELGELFGVSRGVIREAIKVLITLGAVESRQGSGTFVAADLTPMVSRALVLSARPEPGSLSDLMEMRAPLERFAARLAAERRSAAQSRAISLAATESNDAATRGDWDAFGRADARFHTEIYEASSNPLLITVMSAIREIQQNAVALVASVPGSMPIAAQQHLEIAAAIWNGDPDRAERLMSEHVAYSTVALMTTLSAHPNPPRAANRRIGDNGRKPEPVEPSGR